MIKYLLLWFKFFQISLIEKMGFRANFVTEIIIEVAWALTTVFLLELIFYQVDNLAGWSKGEVFLIYALFRMSSALMAMLARKNLLKMSDLINRGELDFYILKPIDTLFHISFRQVAYERFSQFIVGGVMLVYATQLMQVHWQLEQILLMGVLIIIGGMIRYGLSMCLHLLVFWFEKVDNIIRLELTFTSVARYPRQALPLFLRFGLTFVLPIMLIAAIPAEIVLKKLAWYYLLPLLVFSLGLVGLSRLIFNLGLRSYSSVSS